MNLEEYLKQLETLVNIDCGSYNHEGIRKVSEYLKAWYSEIGWHIVEHELENGTPVLEISNHKECDHYDAMFIGHMDTVFPDGTVNNRPFTTDGKNCYGPGVEDMKNGVLAMLHIAKNLPEDINNKLNICMCYNPDEEIGSRLSTPINQKMANRADRVFVMESESEGGGHVFSRKGKVDYTLSFKGIAAHAGYMFQSENANAIEKMGYFITEIAKLKDSEKDTSVNIGLVIGGTSVNTIPDSAKMQLEARFHTIEERNRVVNGIENLIKSNNDKVKVEIEDFYETPAWVQTDESKKYIEHLSAIAENMNLDFYEKKRGGLSDANRLCEVCDIILDGMGPCGGYAHSEREYMVIDAVKPCVQFFIEVLKDLSKNK